MSESTMKRCNFFLPISLLSKLQEKSKESGVPMAELVRRALVGHLAA